MIGFFQKNKSGNFLSLWFYIHLPKSAWTKDYSHRYSCKQLKEWFSLKKF